MKFFKRIKKTLGIVYILVFSFGLSISLATAPRSTLRVNAGDITNGTWSIDANYELLYDTLDFTFEKIEQTELLQESETDFSLSVEMWGYSTQDPQTLQKCDTDTLVFTNALFSEGAGTGDSVGTLYGTCVDLDNGNPVTINVYLTPQRQSVTDEGWQYDSSTNSLYYINPESPEASYVLESGIYSVLTSTATLTYEDMSGSANQRYVEAVITSAVHNTDTTHNIAGYMNINGVSTYVVIDYDENDLVILDVDQWVYSDMSLRWVANDGEEYDYSDLGIQSAHFFQSNNQFRVIFLYDDTDLPEVVLSSATYELHSEQGDGYYEITGYSSTFGAEQGSLNIGKFYLTFIGSETGWVYDAPQQTFIYCVGGTIQPSNLSSGTYYSYGDYYDYAVLTYVSSYNNETVSEEITVTSASYDDEDDPIIVTGTYNDQAISLKAAADLLDIQFQSRWHNDGESNYFTYWNDLDDECGGTIERVIYNNYGYESVNNECYITIAAYSNDISQEFICRTNLVIYSALIEVDPRVSQDGGMIGGYWTELGHPEKEVHIHVDNIDIENTIGEGWNYMNGFDDFIYQTPQGENCAVYVTSAVFDGRDENNATCTFNYTYESREDGTHTGSFVMKDATVEQEQTGNQQGIISGVWPDFSEDTITVRTPILTMNEDPYWTYNDGYLEYIDPTNPDIETVMVSCIYYIDDECFELDYNLVNNRDGGYDTATIILANAELGRDYNPDAEEPAERSGYISGNCSTIGDTNNYITLIVDVTIQKREPDPEPPFWSYSDGYLLYIDPSNENIELTMVSCVFYTEESKFDLEYKIEDKVTNEFTIATITLLNGEIGRDYDPTGEEPAQRSGYISGNCSVLDEEENYITLIVDMTIQKVAPEVPVTEPAWVYNDDALALWWSDPAHQEYETELEEAYYYERTHSVTFLYSIVTYTVVGQNPDQPTSEALEQEKVRAVIFQKNAHMNDIEYEDDLEAFVTVTGTCVECEDATKLVVPRDKFITATYDDDPGTITPDQQVDIKELLPEETTVDQQRMEESIVAISSETAHEIIVTVNDAHEQNDAAFAAGEITEEAYIENKGIIQTVTEASVVVGAGAITASDEGKAVDDALPDDHDLDEPMTKTLDDFYQLQMDYLLGKKKAPDKQDNRVIYRTGEPQQASIDLTISKEDYAKMINFVDTAVSNMKDAALKIRKCSSAKMKMVVKDYISVVKVSSFREFNEQAANAEYVEAIYKATMLNMQQQVIEALKREHKPSNNAERERQYQEQLVACEDYDTFEQIVIEVLRLKYDSIEGEKLAYKDANDFFENIYMPIFKSWALDDPSINPTNITLEELTKATIETTTSKASKMTFRADVSKEESTFLIILGASLGAACIAGITLPIVFRKRRRGLAK